MRVGDNMKDQFKEEIKQQFTDAPDILNRIKQDHRFFVPEKKQKSSIFDLFKSTGLRYSLTSAFILVIMFVVMLSSNTDTQIYAATVTLDINPQIEIILDEDDIVIEVNFLNDDGVEIFSKDIEYKGMTLDEVLELIIDRLDEEGIIISEEENIIMVHVEGVDQTVIDAVLDRVEQRIQYEGTARNKIMRIVRTNDIELTNEELAQIKELQDNYNINPGRVILIYRIQQMDDSYTISELTQMSMRELYNLEKALENNGNRRPFDNYNNKNGVL